MAEVLALFADPARLERAAGLAFDLVGGSAPVEQSLDDALKRGETAFFG